MQENKQYKFKEHAKCVLASMSTPICVQQNIQTYITEKIKPHKISNPAILAVKINM